MQRSASAPFDQVVPSRRDVAPHRSTNRPPFLRTAVLVGAVALTSVALATSPACADGPADNLPDKVRRLPKPGVEVPAEQRTRLEAEIRSLAEQIVTIRSRTDARSRELWPDVAIYHKAADVALQHDEFFQPKEIDDAFRLLAIGRERAEQLLRGEAPWTTAVGLVVRGYVSKIDDSVQPYGLVVPPGYTDRGPGRFRTDLWLHGRGETLSELNFIRDRAASAGTFQPADTIVLHPYGRWNNAFKLAGEVDVLEALDSVRRRYRVDDDRIAVRGFSMGGAGAWHLAVHYPDRWFAANPGAGFSETPEFLKSFQKQTLEPTWFEEKLWRLYDCPGWAINLKHCPTVAYSGAKDVQKQAADVMEPAFAQAGMRLVHVIGPETAHSYHPAARDEVDRRLADLARHGRRRSPLDLHFITYTLRYNRCHWMQVDELVEHWEPATVRARIAPADNSLHLHTSGASGLTLNFASGDAPLAVDREVAATIETDGASTTLRLPGPASDGSWNVSLHRTAAGWKTGARPVEGLRKRSGLQGPIDDAFLDSFLMVHPTGAPYHETTALWVDAEMERAVEHWRRHFRGDARVKEDRQVTDDDLARSNLILWGDPSSNQILARIAEKLPIRWNKDRLQVGEQSYAGDRHALIAVYPNPLNPARYIVINSGFTFRDFAHLNNARQVPVLPDWAVVDLSTPPGAVWPGKIVAADFFDETWQLKPARR